MLTRHESMTRDINAVLKERSRRARKEVEKSCMGCFTKLENYNMKNGLMIHYVVFREVKPTPNPDETTLWFKICGKVIHFSREEYALVSGLRFGQEKFNPYKVHRMDENSVFAWLFRCNEKTATNNVYKMFTKWKFWYYDEEGEKVLEVVLLATDDDFCESGCSPQHLFSDMKHKEGNPVWFWVLLEDKDAWEEFLWRSYSYQALISSIKILKTDEDRVPKFGIVSYHITGNILPFFHKFTKLQTWYKKH